MEMTYELASVRRPNFGRYKPIHNVHWTVIFGVAIGYPRVPTSLLPDGNQ
jgi:hypothetical protein